MPSFAGTDEGNTIDQMSLLKDQLGDGAFGIYKPFMQSG